jgi:hypothetical protein
MPIQPQALHRGLQLFRPPYQFCEPLDLDWRPRVSEPGTAAVWFMVPEASVYPELEWLWERPRTMPFFIVLPEPEDIPPLASVLRSVPIWGPEGPAVGGDGYDERAPDTARGATPGAGTGGRGSAH